MKTWIAWACFGGGTALLSTAGYWFFYWPGVFAVLGVILLVLGLVGVQVEAPPRTPDRRGRQVRP